MKEQEIRHPDQEQKDKIEELWKTTGLLEGISNRYQRSAVAVLLENQRLVNEMLVNSDKADSRLTRMSIPFARRVFGRSDLFQMVSVQPLLSTTGMAMVLDGYRIPRSYEIPSRPMRLTPPVPDTEEGADLEQEAELIAELAMEYSQHITRHVVEDLRKAAGIQLNHVYRSAEDLVAYIKMASGKLVREMGGQATWIVVSPSIAYEIIEAETDFQLFETPDYIRKDVDFHKFGLWNKRWTVYVDPLAPNTSVVMGHKGESYLEAGYVFSPYALYTQGVKEGDSTNIVSLIGKRLVYPGFYASINIGNYSITEIEREDQDEEFLDRTSEDGRSPVEETSEQGSQRGTDAEGVRGRDPEVEEDNEAWNECESDIIAKYSEGNRIQEEDDDVNAVCIAPQCESSKVAVSHDGGAEGSEEDGSDGGCDDDLSDASTNEDDDDD